MHPPAHLFALARRSAPAVFAWHTAAYRYAHAAAFADDSDDNLGQSQSQQAGPSRPRRRVDDYRFPEKGRRGGPPDPYEVLGLERSAGAGEIKSQCE